MFSYGNLTHLVLAEQALGGRWVRTAVGGAARLNVGLVLVVLVSFSMDTYSSA